MTDASSTSAHDVAVPAATLARLGWTGTPEDLLRHSFEFLLARERKESILPSFSIEVIGSYFQEWKAAVRRGFRD